MLHFEDETSGEFAAFQLCVSEKFSLSDATEDFFVSPFALALLDAVYGYGLALKEAWFKQCGGRPGLCPQLVSMSNEVQYTGRYFFAVSFRQCFSAGVLGYFKKH